MSDGPDVAMKTGQTTRGGERFRVLAALFCIAVSLSLGCATTPTVATPAAPPPPAFAEWPDSVLYFVVLDRFADGSEANNAGVDRNARGTFHGGDLAGLTAQLDEIASLGATAIWITPVVKNIPGFVTGAGFPDWGYHGYWADDFHSVDPRFGSEEELKKLVDAAHARGMRVLLDVVYNHAGYGSRLLTDPQTKGWLRSTERESCGNDDLTICVSGLPDFRTELPEVADWLMDAQLEMARRAGIDGFRLDTVKHIDHSFWKEHRARTRAELNPDFFLVGEVWGGDAQSLDPWFAGDEMDAGFDFSFQGSLLGWLQGRGRTVAFDRYLKSRQKVREGYLLAHFLSSHDVETAMSILEGDRELFRLAALVQFTSGGLPTIYYGDEVGRRGGKWPENRSDMPWGDRPVEPGAGDARDEALREDYKRLIAIRRAHRALSRGVHETVSTEGDLLLFARHDSASGDRVIVAVNRGQEPARGRFAIPSAWSGKTIRDEWSGVALTTAGDAVEFEVAPRGARIISAAP
jgi:glycosidase